MKRTDRSVKFIMVKVHVSSEMDIPTRVSLNTVFFMEKVSSSGLMALFIRVSSRAMRLLVLENINGQMVQHMMDK